MAVARSNRQRSFRRPPFIAFVRSPADSMRASVACCTSIWEAAASVARSICCTKSTAIRSAFSLSSMPIRAGDLSKFPTKECLPVVVAFRQCVARPDTDAGQNLLIDHLNAVAAGAGDACGGLDQRLGFLAGLLHDAGKCHEEWQDYIAPASRRKRGPPHAPIGTALFLFAAEKLISDLDQ
jgi:hypothetical protein